ncbi:hypothetical protein HK105_203225 [Polyrhizophydium stewartii]|uniref:Uncharacterized protein n=1 Tax=Polyrhizophydium stewartii TaxID=2732419 RepID=A0ABR4NCJ5_9FUNG
MQQSNNTACHPNLITTCTDPRIQAYRDTIGFSREFFVLLWQHAHEVAGLLPAPDVVALLHVV